MEILKGFPFLCFCYIILMKVGFNMAKIEKSLLKFQKYLSKKGFNEIKTYLKDDCLVLEGELKNYEDIVSIGLTAAKTKAFYGIINNIKLKGFKEPPMRISSIKDKKYDGTKCDVLVIGGGIVGCAILRELSKYEDVNTFLVEKESDVALQASSRNDGNIHVGIDLHKGSKKLDYLSRAVPIYPRLAKELKVPYKKYGQLIAFDNPLYSVARIYLSFKVKKNGIKEYKWLNRKQIHELEPNIADKVCCGAFFGTGAVVSPYGMSIALAESAINNGAKVLLNCAVTSMSVKDNKIEVVHTNRGDIYPSVVINAAGVFSDKIAEMANDRFFTIHPRKGTNSILDKKAASKLSTTSCAIIKLHNDVSTKHSKGGGTVLTADDNPLVGPTADEIPLREDFTVERHSIDEQFNKHIHNMPKLNKQDIITYFSGIRAATYEEDFVVEKGKWTKNIVHAAGIQSPGITAAPSIAKDVAKWSVELLDRKIKKKTNFIHGRTTNYPINKLDDKTRNDLIKKNPDYGQIVCRCEEISKGEILDCLRGPMEINSMDAIKRRVRAGMGRCQGGFCSPLVLQIMKEELKLDYCDITKKGEGKVLVSDIKAGDHNA